MTEPIGDVTVLVMAAPNRGIVGERCRESIELSDIGKRYEWHEHPNGRTVLEHYREIMGRARAASTKLVMFLEDDAIVGRHILHNVRTWPEVDDPRFGVGWLMNPGGVEFRDLMEVYEGKESHTEWLRRERLHISAGLLFRTADLPELLTHVYAWQDEHDSSVPHTDLAVSGGVWRMGRHICMHATPSLVEHQIEDSKLGHGHHPSLSTSRGTFRLKWRRGARQP